MIKPYYEEAGIQIWHGDCREILPSLPKVDLVLTDPPYVNLKGGFERDYQGGVGAKVQVSISVGNPWEASFDWVSLAWDRAIYGAMIFCSHSSVVETAQIIDARRVALLTWYKRNSPPTGKNVVRFTSEFIWAFAKEVGLKWDNLSTTVFDIPNANAGCMATERFVDKAGLSIHPTQKPLRLLKELLIVGGDLILDPFMGSGTTLRAAKDLGRKAIGIEIEEKYCEIAANRLRQEVLTFA